MCQARDGAADRRAGQAGTMVQDRPVRLIGALHDPTSRMAERLALETANERLALATESAGIGIWEFDLVRSNLIWDPLTARLLGRGRSVVEPSRALFYECVHPGDRQRVSLEFEAAKAGGAPLDTTFRVMWPDGSVHILRSAARTTSDAAGSLVRLVGAIWDITDSRALALDLAQQHELLRVTLQSIGDGVITTDSLGRVGWLNPAAEKMTGWRSADACGRPATDVFRIVDAAACLPAGDPLAQCLLDGREPHLAADRQLMSRDGTRFGIEDTAAPIRNDDGQILGAVLVFRDVTEQREIEAGRAEREQELRVINTELERLARHLAKARDSADRANSAKSRFLAGMSHELRTPLNGILGYAQLLRMEGGLGPKQQARVDAMVAAGSHLLEMVNSVLDLSEIEAEHVELRAVEIDLQEIVAACVDQIRPAAANKALTLRIVVAPGAPRVITTDPVRLRQMLLNLLGNAVKFTPAGWIELRMASSADRSAARIDVIDSGPGIPVDQREHLFVEFDRLDADRVRSVEGSGLGLALSSRLAALMDGRLGYQESPGGGSIFWLELPLRRSDRSRQELGPDMKASPRGHAEGMLADEGGGAPMLAARRLRVLVVDDIAMNRDIALSFLKVAGHEVVCAESGMDAIAAVAGDSFDVVLMDVRMPGTDGLAATRQIRELDGPGRDVPIIGLTAQAFAEQIEACRQAGMDEHLAKPYGPAALMAAVASAIDRRRPSSAMIAQAPSIRPEITTDTYGLIGADLPVSDRELIDRLASFLPPDVILNYLKTIITKCEAMLVELDRWAPPEGGAVLADSVHALTGSAGMFGFARLAGVGRMFEQALRSGAPAAPQLAAAFRSAIGATLQDVWFRTNESPG